MTKRGWPSSLGVALVIGRSLVQILTAPGIFPYTLGKGV